MRNASAIVSLSLVLALLTTTNTFSQPGSDELRKKYADLGGLLDAAWLTQARAFEAIVGIGNSPVMSEAREKFAASLRMRADMSMADMMVMMRMQAGMQMLGPFDELEFPASNELKELLTSTHSRRGDWVGRPHRYLSIPSCRESMPQTPRR